MWLSYLYTVIGIPMPIKLVFILNHSLLLYLWAWYHIACVMMMSWQGHIMGPLCGQSTSDSPYKGSIIQSFDVCIDISLNKLLDKKSSYLHRGTSLNGHISHNMISENVEYRSCYEFTKHPTPLLRGRAMKCMPFCEYLKKNECVIKRLDYYCININVLVQDCIGYDLP